MSSNTTEGEVGIHVTCEEPTNMIIFHAAPKHIDIEKESVSVTDISKHGEKHHKYSNCGIHLSLGLCVYK